MILKGMHRCFVFRALRLKRRIRPKSGQEVVNFSRVSTGCDTFYSQPFHA